MPAPAAASDRGDQLAAVLKRDPIYVTDHAPRALPADAAARIKASVSRLGVPAFVAVTPSLPNEDADDLVALLHDRLDKNGLYIVVAPSGTPGEARQFGSGRVLDAEMSWSAANNELPTDAGAVKVIERFVEVSLSGKARERRDNRAPRPPSRTRIALDAHDRTEKEAERKETRAFAAGTALSGVTILGGLVLLRRWRTRR
ncbi:hypothetical protein [Spirillospora sp. NPDC047279]|uniref:hypothetical protein n=1 Tax=Spirillospora sp. NPDC047279 TaxID=3155478 RepID=UPI0033F3819A